MVLRADGSTSITVVCHGERQLAIYIESQYPVFTPGHLTINHCLPLSVLLMLSPQICFGVSLVKVSWLFPSSVFFVLLSSLVPHQRRRDNDTQHGRHERRRREGRARNLEWL